MRKKSIVERESEKKEECMHKRCTQISFCGIVGEKKKLGGISHSYLKDEEFCLKLAFSQEAK
jgi:hypothetical protein